MHSLHYWTSLCNLQIIQMPPWALKTPLNPWVLVMTSKFNSVIATLLKISHLFPFHLMAVVAWQLRRRNCGSVVIWARFILNPAHSNGQVFDIVVFCCRRSMRPDKLTLENTNLFCTFWHISNLCKTWRREQTEIQRIHLRFVTEAVTIELVVAMMMCPATEQCVRCLLHLISKKRLPQSPTCPQHPGVWNEAFNSPGSWERARRDVNPTVQEQAGGTLGILEWRQRGRKPTCFFPPGPFAHVSSHFWASNRISWNVPKCCVLCALGWIAIEVVSWRGEIRTAVSWEWRLSPDKWIVD